MAGTAAIGLSLGAAWWSLREDEVTSVPLAPIERTPVQPRAVEPGDSPPEPVVELEPPPPLPGAPGSIEGAAPLPPGAPIPRPPKHPVDPEAFARASALLERAREQVQSQPEAALKTLLELPEGSLGEDADVVRLEALLRLSQRGEAETLGRKLLARDPSLKKTVERLLTDVRPN